MTNSGNPSNLRSLVSEDPNRTGDRNSEEGRVAPGLKSIRLTNRTYHFATKFAEVGG
jgi:hypothetical protein